MRSFSFLFSFICVSASFSACTKDGYNNCGAEPGIRMFSKVNNFWIESDTIQKLDDFRIYAESSEAILAYKWMIEGHIASTDSIYSPMLLLRGRSFELELQYNCGTYTKSKIPYVWPDDEYYQDPNDPFVNICTKHYRFPIHARYRGYYESNPTQVVTIDLTDSLTPQGYVKPILNNFPYVGASTLNAVGDVEQIPYLEIDRMPMAIYYESSGFGNNPSTAYPALEAMASLDRHNRNRLTITVVYTNPSTGQQQYDVFSGYRI